MTTQLEVNMAVLTEQMKRLLDDNDEARASRKEQYKVSEDMRRDILDISNRLHVVEKQFAEAAPTLAEFIVLKHKVSGAGMLGRWLWAIGGVLIGSVAAISGIGTALKSWLMGN